MTALGQKRELFGLNGMSGLPPEADITSMGWHVRFVPVGGVKLSYTITSPDRRLEHGSLFITSPRSASGALQSRFQGAV